MFTSDFNYHLPKESIAQTPIRPRDRSRLLIYERKTGKIQHRHFYDLPKFLQPGDILVLNNSKVIPARLLGRKKATGGQIEIFLLKKVRGAVWQCLVGGKGRRPDLKIQFFNQSNKKQIILSARLVKDNQDGTWLVKFDKSGQVLTKIIERIGQTPTPPYIKVRASLKDYQTIYAKQPGSVAAPTAGFHFTKQLFQKLKKMGVQTEFITLHVGLGTFQPVKLARVEQHRLHPELAILDKETAQRLNQAKAEKRRIVAVGTTSVRVLESFVEPRTKKLKPQSQWVQTFIYPPYKFKFVNALITNFHLPQSTLLMLVSACIGSVKKTLQLYQKAVKLKYRFYSFGDAMFIY